ncbi:MAG: hypothetical protein ACLPQY_12940, partial [Streptosporangiaceae bacterium]
MIHGGQRRRFARTGQFHPAAADARPSQAHTGPVRTAPATAAAREERLSSRTTFARVPVRYAHREAPLGDIGVAQSLHDELQHIQVARRQHERERLRGHTPKP